MKAWRIDQHGGPEVYQWVDLPKQTPGPYEVLVQVEAVGLNHLDVWVRKGVEGHQFPLPLIPGCDISGTIIEFGAGSEEKLQKEGLALHSPVIVSPGISCGRCQACLSGFDPICKFYGILGETQNGGCAETVVIPIANLIKRPPEMTPEEGAALPIPFLTAWTMLVRKCHIQPGDIVLIHAGGSGVSVAAIQIAKLLGARVITTVGNDSKIEPCRKLGADWVINYKKSPFRQEVRKILTSLDKKGCDIVVDHIGKDTFQESLKSLAWGGKLVTCGSTSGSKIDLDLKLVFFKNISIFGSTMGSKADLIRIVSLVAERKLSPVIDTVYDLEKLPEAIQRLEERTLFGKIILKK